MTDKIAPDAEPTDLTTALIELRHARTEVERLRPFVDMVDQAQRDAETAEQQAPLLALKAREAAIRDHTLNLHLIGEQLSGIESWFWAHLADVRDAARQQIGGPLPDDAVAIEPEPSDPAQCSGEEGFCPEHGFHRHSLKQPGEVDDVTEPEPACGPACAEQHTYDWTCEQFAGIDHGSQPGETAEQQLAAIVEVARTKGVISIDGIRAITDPPKERRVVTDDYEQITGHAITCTAGFTGNCDCP